MCVLVILHMYIYIVIHIYPMYCHTEIALEQGIHKHLLT